MRPDPHSIPRRPMATTEAKIAITGPQHADHRAGFIFESEHLNVDTLHSVVEQAEVMAEGRADLNLKPQRFFGSWTIAFTPAEVREGRRTIDDVGTRLGRAIEDDARAWRVIEDKTYRELSRLLGVETSVDFECQVRTVTDGSTIRIVVDFECPITPMESQGRALK
ncbi:MAG: hypothetical protein VX589_08795 [Myxococcota bacterium]|nr:hypothetical protein [Myxococcota bacterium]